MTSSVCFHQGCPVCGRTLRIGIHLLGSRVYCQHCGGGFRASDPALGDPRPEPADRPQPERVDALLERAALLLQRQVAWDGHDERSRSASAASRFQ
jgi:hypothetical protein